MGDDRVACAEVWPKRWRSTSVKSVMTSVRTREPFRRQGVMRFEIPEDTLPPEHRARGSRVPDARPRRIHRRGQGPRGPRLHWSRSQRLLTDRHRHVPESRAPIATTGACRPVECGLAVAPLAVASRSSPARRASSCSRCPGLQSGGNSRVSYSDRVSSGTCRRARPGRRPW